MLATFTPLTEVHAADDWLELRTPHFTVISEASTSRTRDWAVEFELFRRAMTIVMPVEPAAVEPVTLILFRSDRRLQAFKPRENGRAAAIAGWFSRSPGRNLIAISIEGARDDVRELIFHEAVHWHLAAAERTRPLWLEEGLAQVFGNFRLSGNAFVVGAARPDVARQVRAAPRLTFAELMAIQPTGLSYDQRHGEQTGQFYRQAWAMTHALVFGAGTAALAAYLQQPPQEPNPTRDFERGFGLAATAMDARLVAYLERGVFRTLTVPFDRSAVEGSFALRAAPAAEVDLALGNLLAAAGRPAEAEPWLARAAATLPSDPRAAEALAGMHVAAKNASAAAAQFEAALARGSRSYAAHHFLGEWTLRRAHPAPPAPADIAAAAEHFVRCLQLNPRFLPACEALGTLAALLPAPSAEVQAMVQAAAARFPTSVKLQAGLAFLAARRGDQAEARAAAARAQATVDAK